MACESLGYSREELLDRHISDIGLEFDSSEIHVELRRKDGASFPVEIHRDINHEEILILAHDLTRRMAGKSRQDRLSRLYRALSEVNQAIVRMEDEEKLIPLLCRMAVDFGGMKMAWAGRLNEKSGRIEPVVSHGSGTDYLKVISISGSAAVPEGRGPSALAYRENRHVIVNRIQEDELMKPWRESAALSGFQSCGSFPVFRGNKPFSVFTVYSDSVDAFDDEIVELLVEMAKDISFALDNFDREAVRRQAEASLEASERHFRAYFERAMVGMAATSAQMKWLEVNDAMCSILGYSREELMNLSWADLTHPDDIGANLEKYDLMLSGKSDGHVIENRFIRKDGSIVHAHRVARALRNPDGSIDYVVAVVEDITERKLADMALRASEEKFSKTFHNSPNAMSITSLEDGKIIEVNEAWISVSGYARDEAAGRTAGELGLWKTAEDRKRIVEELKKNGHVAGFETIFVNRNGEEVISLVSAETVEIMDEPCIVMAVQDITELRTAVETIREQNAFLNAIFENEPHCVKVVSMDGKLIQMNRAGLAMLEIESQEAVQGYGFLEFISPQYKKLFAEFHRSVCSGRSGWLEFPVIGAKGTKRWLETHATPMKDANGRTVALLGVTRDITEKKQKDALIWKQANYDLLTDLPNRYMFHDRLEQEIKRAHLDGEILAVFFIDLDRFKEVNDTLGHQSGDMLLMDAAKRIRDCVRESDTVARLGGDEFTVILSQHDHVEKIAQDLLDRLAEPFSIEDDRIYVSASIGITLYPSDAEDVDQLLKNADQAMYAAKNAGRNRFSYFTSSLQEEAQTRLRLLKDLRSCLQQNQFRLYFQPIVELSTSKIVKAEALLRWNHPDRGMVSPMEFIPLAEETGLILPIGDWVFMEAARWAKLWAKRRPDLKIGVNMSPLQFKNMEGNIDVWLDHLRELGLSGSNIVMEITEGLLLDADMTVTEKLIALRNAGIEIAIDDFGTGYSALSYLKKFQIDYLKIDKSFIRNLDVDRNDMALCDAIIVMAHKLGLEVIAEGVETEVQRDLLRHSGCDYAQGYYYSPPLPAEELESLF